MPSKKNDSEPLKVTDKRLFTSEGELKEEFRGTVTPADPVSRPVSAPAAPPETPESKEADKKKSLRDKAANPGTPFATFVESLIIQGYMSLGMLKSPYHPQGAVDLQAARQMIDIITMLSEKTKGNLSEDESDFLLAHLGEIKLAFVQRNKAL